MASSRASPESFCMLPVLPTDLSLVTPYYNVDQNLMGEHIEQTDKLQDVYCMNSN